MPLTRQLPITFDDVEAAARDAYDMFVAANTAPRPYEALSESSKQAWRRVARGVLGHVVAA